MIIIINKWKMGLEIMKKYSKQRELILESLKHRKDHPTAEKLYMDLKKKMPDLGIATVYRNLTELCQEGLVTKVKSKTGPDRYDGNELPHIHFECKKCGDFIDIYLTQNQIVQMHTTMKKLSNEIEAEYEQSDIYLTGLCKKCKNTIKKTG